MSHAQWPDDADDFTPRGPTSRLLQERQLPARDRRLMLFGAAFRVVAYAAIILVLALTIDPRFIDTPLSSLTLGNIFSEGAKIGGCVGLVYYLFKPARDVPTRKAWGWLGLLIMALVGATIIFALSRA